MRALDTQAGCEQKMTTIGRMLVERPRIGWLLVAVGAVAVFLVSVPAIILRPTGIEWAIWWPAAGVAIGIALRVPRRFAVVLIAVLTLTFVLAQFAGGRPAALALALGVAAGLEVAVVYAILRGRGGRAPRLARVGDLLTLLLAAVAGAAVLALVAGIAIAVQISPDAVLEYAQTTVVAHLVGIIVVTPLFFDYGASRLAGHRIEFGLQWLSVAGTLAIVAAAGAAGLPLAFLLLGPLVWGAARFGGRLVIVQFLIVMVVAAEFGGTGGLIAVDGLPPEATALMVQLFVLSSGIVLLAVLALAGRQRRVLRLSSAAIDASLTGFAELRDRAGRWSVAPLNDAARLVLGAPERELDAVFDEASAEALRAIAGRTPEEAESLGGSDRVTTRDDRILQAAVAPLLDPESGRRGEIERRYSLQFVDVTDSIALAQAEEEELRRAADMQRALLPDGPPPGLTGWQLAGACLPSRDVGGDFYAWSLDGSTLAVTLGDVMGKGLGAGVMAASLQTAVRLTNTGCSPSVVLARSAAAVAEQLDRASTFATIVHAHVDTATGDVVFADAGHGLTFIVRPDGAYQRLGSVHLPLGVDGAEVFTDGRSRIEPGDVLVSVSDGALDAFPDSDDQLADLAAHVAGADSAQQVVDATIGLSRLPGIADDITVVALMRDKM